MTSKILNHVDFERANALLEGFNKSTGFVTAILDLDGNILAKSGWRQICTDFHRKNAKTASNCLVSDTVMGSNMRKDEKFLFYQCMNGLIDVQAPIVVRGEHVANLFSGQFIFEEPDISFFKNQAITYGFEEGAYLESLKKVPVVSKEKAQTAMEFLLNITGLIFEMTADKIEQIEINEAIKKSEAALLESRILQEQNMKDLMESQRIAKLGTWRLNLATNEVVWSEELYKMYGFDPTIPPPPYTEHMKLFTPESWNKLSAALEHTRTSGIPYELELETVTIDESNGWMWVRGEAQKDSEGNIVSLWGAAQDITEYKKILLEIQQSEEKFQLLFNKAPLGYQSLDYDGYFIEVNQQWLDTMGYRKYEVVGKWFGDFLCPEYVEGFRQRFPVFKSQGHIHSEFEMLHKDGRRLTIAFEGKIAYGTTGEFKQTHCILQDITNQRKAEKALLESEERYRYLFEYSGVGIGYYTVDGVAISFNKKAMDFLGGKLEDYTGKSVNDLFLKENAEKYFTRIEKAATNDEPQQYEDYYVTNTGHIWFSSIFTRIMNVDGKVVGIQITSTDITERKKAERELTYASYHDHLTGFYNRRFFEEEFKRLDTPKNLPISVIICDINGLKLINDSFGHNCGDELLVKTAKSIKNACPANAVVSRIGGDEFAVLLPKTDAKKAAQIAGSISGLASKEIVQGVEISISYGYDTKTNENQKLVEVLANAENYMYRHKLYERSSTRSKTIDIIMSTLFEKSSRESLHSARVSNICKAIASQMNFSKDSVNKIGIAGLVHDIGKIGVDERILNKSGRLNDDEIEQIYRHPEIGWRILSSVNEFSELAQFVLSHQERWDGSGYPNGLKGEEISLEARIITVADAYDAMTGERTYKPALTQEEAIKEVKRCSGTQFDPAIVKVLLERVLPCDTFN